jgi:hypothetical protein
VFTATSTNLFIKRTRHAYVVDRANAIAPSVRRLGHRASSACAQHEERRHGSRGHDERYDRDDDCEQHAAAP